MSPRLVRLLVYGAITLAAIALARWWWSDERRLWSRLDHFESDLAKSGEEGALVGLAEARAVAGYFAPGFLVEAQPFAGTLSDPQELTGAVYRYRSGARWIRVSDSARELEIDHERGTAEMRLVLEILGDEGGGPGRERLRLRLAWAKLDGEWEIHEAEIVEVLERGLW